MKQVIRFTVRIAIAIFLLINILAAWHAYKFTHYEKDAVMIARSPEELSLTGKMKVLVSGVSLPRPTNKALPAGKYTTVFIDQTLECWQTKVEHSKGTVLLFHGYGSCKSSNVGKSQEFNKMGYSTLMIDFHGSGGSAGNSTTIGYNEACDVKACYDYINKETSEPVILYGTSMGAAAIMKCVSDTKIQPKALILECPFGTMQQTVENRFSSMGLPSFPMANLLVFYGGLLNGFWAFSHNPSDYADNINVPVLLLCGGKDERVTQAEIDSIYMHLPGSKRKVIYPNAKHESYLKHYREEWKEDVICFLGEGS